MCLCMLETINIAECACFHVCLPISVYICLGGEDYNPTPFPASLTLTNDLPSLRACTLIAIQNDLDVEGDEEFLVSLEPSLISGMFTFSPNQTSVRVLDNDIQGG